MAGNRDIHGDVILDVELSGEERAKARLQEKFAKLSANVNVNLNLPTRKAIQAQLDTVTGKGGGIKLKISQVVLPARTEIQAQLDREARKGRGIKLLVGDLNLPGRSEMQAQLDTKVGARGLKLNVTLNVTKESLVPVIAAQQDAQKAISDVEFKEEQKRETFRAREREKRTTQDNAALRRRELNEDASARRLLANETQIAARREIIQDQLNARLAAQDNLFNQRRVLAAERAQRQLQDRANKPILQQVLLDTRRLNSSLGDFDRAITSALRISLTAFSVWEAGVVASLAAVGIAAEADFAKFEAASRRAAATAASSSISDQISKNQTVIHNFAETASADLELINAKAKAVSLETVGISATDAATGIQTLVQAGQTLPQALSNISIAAKFSQVNNEELTKTTEDLAGAMAAAGISSKDTARFLDQVQLSSQNAIGGAGDFLEALANGASASARAFGENNLQAQAFVQLLANTGTTGKTAGTQAAIVFRDFNKVIGQSQDELKQVGIDTSTFTKTVTGIAAAFDAVKKSGGNVTAFSKQLGFTQRSLNNILRIVPQLQQIGPEGFDRIVDQLKNANGIIQQQVDFQRKGIAAQFDNLKDTVGNLSKTFGEAASGPVSDFLDLFAGTDSKLSEATGTVRQFGVEFGEIVEKLTQFVQTDNFTNGILTLEEAIKVSVEGARDTIQAFAGAFDETGEAKSTFEAFADTVLAFARLSANVLPRVAAIIGEIFDFLIDHADAFETFAKITLSVYLARKAFVLLINPIGTALEQLLKFNGALAVTAATGEGGAFVSFVATVATKLGIMTAATEAATVATLELAAAQAATSSTGAASVASAGAAALGKSPTFRGLGFFKNAKGVGDAGRAGANALGEGEAVAKAGLSAKNAKLFEGFAASLDDIFKAGTKAVPVLGEIGAGFAKVAGPVAIVTAIIEGAIGFVKGFTDELTRGSKGGGDFAASLKEMQPVFEALIAAGKVLLSALNVVFRLGASIGRLVAGVVRDFVSDFADGLRGIKLLFEGDFIGALKAFGDVIVNTITQPFRLAIGFLADIIADSLEPLTNIPKIGDDIERVQDEVRDFGESARDFRLNLSSANDELDNTKDKTEAVGTAAEAAAPKFQLVTAAAGQSAQAVAAINGQIQNTALVSAQAFNDLNSSVQLATQGFLGASQQITGFTQPTLADFQLIKQTADELPSSFAAAAGGFQVASSTIASSAQSTAAQVDTVFQAAQRSADFHEAAGGFQVNMAAVTQAGVDAANAIKFGLHDAQEQLDFHAAAGGFVVNMAAIDQAGTSAANNISASFGGVQATIDAVNASLTTLAANGIGVLHTTLDAAGKAVLNEQDILNALNGQAIGTAATLDPTARARAIASQVSQQRDINKQVAAILGDKPLNVGALNGTGDKKTGTKKSVEALTRTFVDPDEAIKAAIDRLKPIQKVAQVSKLIDSIQGKAAKDINLTRQQTELLTDAQPRLEKALERQKTKVDSLNTALQNLQNTQILGTKAASDAQFEFTQQQKALELQQVNLKLGGATDTDPRVVALQKQIDSLQLQAQQADLTASLQLDPLKKKLDDTFTPVKEDTFDNIVAQFDKISKQRDAENTKLTTQTALQDKLNAALDSAKTKYDAIDSANQKSVEAYNKAQQAAAKAANAVQSVGTESAVASTKVKSYSTAVENVPSGKNVVDKSLKGINERIKALEPQFTGAGKNVLTLFTQGMNQQYAQVTVPAIQRITAGVGRTLSAPFADATAGIAHQAGRNVMFGFQQGMIDRSGINADGSSSFAKGTLAEYLHVTIPEWIKKNKGPVSYDATILVPAGQAVMDGFGRGLKQGFGQIQSFVKDVGPSLKEYISGDEFSARIAPIMAGVKLGGNIDASDVNAALADLRASVDFGGTGTSGFLGVSDPTLGFLHKVLSQWDTEQQALQIVKSLGNGTNFDPSSAQFVRPGGTKTASGNDSAHTLGIAADIGAGGAKPTSTTLHLFDVAKQLLGKVFRQVIHNGHGFTAGGGTFPDSAHYDHVHLEFLKGIGFDRYSRKVGTPPPIDIPGASPLVDAAISAGARAYNASLPGLAAVARAESGFDINAVNNTDINAILGHPSRGLFQFIQSTFENFSKQAKAANSGAWIGVKDKWLDPTAQSLTAGWAFTHGHASDWATAAEYFKAAKKFGGFREMGGPVSPNKAYVVGEKRPEIFVPNRPGTILPDTSALGGTGGGYTDNRRYDVTVQTAATDPNAVADAFEARMRSRLAGKGFRR